MYQKIVLVVDIAALFDKVVGFGKDYQGLLVLLIERNIVLYIEV